MIRIGILGAARIAPAAIVGPAAETQGVRIEAVAARDVERARNFAAKHGIARTHEGYDALLADADVDAIYNPLPNGLHCEWTIRALEAGKHVLCEKPFCNNADEAQRMIDAAGRAGRVLMEAFHYRYHPLADRIADEIASLGKIEHVEARMCFPLPLFSDIRYQFELGGGASMDVGAYTANMLRFAAGASGEPELQQNPEVVGVRTKLLRPQVDRFLEADLRWPDGTTGRVRNSMWSRHVLDLSLRVRGAQGSIVVTNPVMPHLVHWLTRRAGGVTSRVRVPGKTTYTYQLEEFLSRIAGGEPKVPLRDSLETMRLIDALYDGAGLRRRGS